MCKVIQRFCGLCLVALLVLGVGCSKDSGEKKAKAMAEGMMGDALSQASGGKMKVDLGSKGSVDLSGLPEMFRYPGAKSLAHTSNAGPGGGEMYVLQTGDPVASVVEQYKQKLSGWKQIHLMESPNMTALVYQTQDETEQVSIMVGSKEGSDETNISVTLMKK